MICIMTLDNSYIGVTHKPVKRHIQVFKKADLAHSVSFEIISPNQGHIFSGNSDVVFPVRIKVHYGQSFKGELRFEGAPYVWKKPVVKNSMPVEINAASPEKTYDLKITPEKPGHYTGKIILSKDGKDLYSKRIGFLYHPEKIQASVPPKDFDEFWDKTLAELDKIPLDMTLEEQKDKETDKGKVYKVKYRSWDRRWAWAWLYVPKAEGKFPARVVCPPVSNYQPGLAKPADGELRIDVAIHGGDIKNRPAIADFNYMNTGIESRESYMLRYGYCCLVRCFDIIKNNNKCNGIITVTGSSQGGGLALVLAALRNPNHVKAVVIALCRIDWTILGHTPWGPRCPKDADPEKIAEVVHYFDPANFAHRIKAPMKLGFGLFDSCAPAEGIYSAVNALPEDVKCQIYVDPYGGHFSFNYNEFNKGETFIEAPRWEGSKNENYLSE